MSAQTTTKPQPAKAQDAGVKLTEPITVKAQKPFDPTDINFFLENLELSETDVMGVEPYQWNKDNPGVDPRQWNPVWRYYREMTNERDVLAKQGIFLVAKEQAIYTQPFSGKDGLFLDSCFDADTGYIHSKIRRKDPVSGNWEPEMVLYLRPIGAFLAAQKRLWERVKDKVERKPEKRKAEDRDELLNIARSMTKTGGVSIEVESDDAVEIGYETV